MLRLLPESERLVGQGGNPTTTELFACRAQVGTFKVLISAQPHGVEKELHEDVESNEQR